MNAAVLEQTNRRFVVKRFSAVVTCLPHPKPALKCSTANHPASFPA